MITKFSGLFLGAAVCVFALQAQQPAQTPAPQPPQPPATQQATPTPVAQSPAGQQPAAGAQDQPQDSGPTRKLGVNEVNLIFTVTAKKGHYIPNLKQSDFALLDDQ